MSFTEFNNSHKALFHVTPQPCDAGTETVLFIHAVRITHLVARWAIKHIMHAVACCLQINARLKKKQKKLSYERFINACIQLED